MSEIDKWILGCTIVLALTAIGALVISTIALNKKQDVKVEQPVSVTITEELHKIFAARDVFENHVMENKREHENMFSKIGGVDRGSATKISSEVMAIHGRINLLDKSNGRLEAATEFQNQQLASMDQKITRLLERDRK